MPPPHSNKRTGNEGIRFVYKLYGAYLSVVVVVVDDVVVVRLDVWLL